MKTIKFDRNCLGWSNNIELNKVYLNCNINYITEKLMAKGYLYLNEIYESFGAKWNPDDYNVCYRAEHGIPNIRYKVLDDNEFVVEIYY